MKALPIAMKLLLNIIFFFIYLLIAVILENFLFWLILTSLGKSVPASSDPIHMKLAGVVLILVIVITGLLRRYFYISMNVDLKKNLEDSKNKQAKKQKVKEEKKVEIIQEEKKNNEDELKIYIDKEIK